MLILLIMIIIMLFFSFRHAHSPLKPGPVVDIDENVITVGQLLPSITNYLDNYKNTVEAKKRGFSKSNFHFTEVHALLNKDQKGNIFFRLVESKSETPRTVFNIEAHTFQHKILSIEEDEPRHGNPFSLNIENWKIDSDQAIDKTIKYVESVKGAIKYDKIYLTASYYSNTDGTEEYVYWKVILADTTQDPEYLYPVSYIDPYTGEILPPPF